MINVESFIEFVKAKDGDRVKFAIRDAQFDINSQDAVRQHYLYHQYISSVSVNIVSIYHPYQCLSSVSISIIMQYLSPLSVSIISIYHQYIYHKYLSSVLVYLSSICVISISIYHPYKNISIIRIISSVSISDIGIGDCSVFLCLVRRVSFESINICDLGVVLKTDPAASFAGYKTRPRMQANQLPLPT